MRRKSRRKNLLLVHRREQDLAVKHRPVNTAIAAISQLVYLDELERSDFINRIQGAVTKAAVKSILDEAKTLAALKKVKSTIKDKIDTLDQLHPMERSIFKMRINVSEASHLAKEILDEAQMEHDARKVQEMPQPAFDIVS